MSCDSWPVSMFSRICFEEALWALDPLQLEPFVDSWLPPVWFAVKLKFLPQHTFSMPRTLLPSV